MSGTIFNENVYIDINDAWEKDQKEYKRDKIKRNSSSLDVIEQLVDVCYAASLSREEESYNNISLAYLDVNYNENTFNNLKGDILFFDTEIEFNDQNLSKLSCSIDYNISSLFVSPSDGGSNKLTIKGLLFNQEFNNIFLNGITHFSGLTGNYKPDLLIINSFLPGVLELNRGMYKLGKLEKGKFVYETQPANHTSFMGEYIKRIFDDSEKLYRRFDCLIEYFLNEVSSRCSGAGVLFVPAELREQVSKDFEINYGIEKDNLRIKSLLDTLSEFNEHLKTDRMESDHFLNILQNINKYVAQRLNFIAQLANIDGALVLTNEFEVIGYGVKLNSKPWKRDVITGPNSADKGGEVFDYKSLGTRHSSMIDVIGYYENCIGYVFSQDGPIRGFVKKNKDTILCWPDCSLTFINY